MRCPFLARTSGDGVWAHADRKFPVTINRVVTPKSSGIRWFYGAALRKLAQLFRNMIQYPVMAELSIARGGRAERVTIREVADEAGVSIATVSRVLNDRADVSAETRELVQRVIRERGYKPNRNAQKLSTGRTGFVGVLVPLVYPAYFSAILAGAAEALYQHDMRLVLSPT